MLAILALAAAGLGFWAAFKTKGAAPDAAEAVEPSEPPGELSDSVRHWAERRNLPFALVMAVIQKESNFRPGVLGSAGEVGLMQVRPDTALAEFVRGTGANYTADDLYNPEVNVEVGTWYLAWIRAAIERGLGRKALEEEILQAYNGGIGNFLRKTVSAKAQAYARSVLSLKGAYA